MPDWQELKEVLAALRGEQPSALVRWPDPSSDAHTPPFVIALAPWAETIASELLDRFGGNVDLTVGALPFPPGRPRRRPLPQPPPAQPLDPMRAVAELDGPAVVRSGHTLSHGLLLRNLSPDELRVATNGQVTAFVVDPRTGLTVGGFGGAQLLPLIMFTVAPGETTRIPLLIGTASFVPDLGYAVPAGDWGIHVALEIALRPRSSMRLRTPVMPLTVTP